MNLPGTLRTVGGAVHLRRAVVEDVPSVVALLTDDQLGAQRDGLGDSDDLQPYLRAFRAIDADDAHLLLVAERGDVVVATMQLSFIPGLARRGALRAQVEAVRVHSDLRSSGLGRAMVAWAIDEARRRGCALVQLTSDKQRHEAHRFYSGLGFTASHEGFKLALESRESLRP
jgi:GNAT superfamily N-acetyltransferase